MQANCNVFILAAGKGTRMGEASKTIPKPLFPIFEATLLSLQIEFARSLGFKKIYLNAHHKSEMISQFINHFYVDDSVVVFVEDNLLDIGGGIHNVANFLGYEGDLLVLNSDIFYFLENDQWKEFLNHKSQGCTLLAYEYGNDENYNTIKFDHMNRFIGVEKGNPTGGKSFTYSGICIVKLDLLRRDSGPSSFFSSVAPPHPSTTVFLPKAGGEYWDFGTKDLYLKNIHRLFSELVGSKKKSHFYNFLISKNALIPEDNMNYEYLSKDGIFHWDDKRKELFLRPLVSKFNPKGLYE